MIPRRFHSKFFITLVIFLGLSIYSNSLNSPFQFDDHEFIRENPAIKNMDNVVDLWNSGWSKARFIGFLSFALNYAFSGLNTFSYHLANLIIHLITTILVWLFMRLLFQTPGMKKSDIKAHKDIFAIAVALLFLVHPIQTQAVTYISQRFTSLAALFYLSTMCFYVKGRLSQNKIIYFFGAGVSAIFGMLTKQISFTIPLNILLFECLFLNEKEGRLKPSQVLVILSFLLIIPLFYRFNITGILSAETLSGSHRGDHITSVTYFLTQPRVIMKYFQLLLIPIGQNIIHDFPMSKSLWEITTLLSFVILIGLIILAVKIRRRHLLLAYGIFWFFLCLAVDSGIVVLRHVIFEHRLYLPSVGFFMALVYLLFQLLKNERRVIALVSISVIVLSFLTVHRNSVWRSEISLWKDAARKSPRLVKPHVQLGMAYISSNQPAMALEAFNAALALSPFHAYVYYDRGIAHQMMGKWEEALLDYSKTIDIDPNYLDAYYNRGNIYGRRKEYEKALKDYTSVIRLNKNFLPAINNRGIIYQNLNRFEEAIDDFNYILSLNPRFISAYINRGNTYKAMKDYTSAIKDYSTVLKINPSYTKAYLLRSFAYKEQKMPQEALNDIKKAKALGVGVPSAYIAELKEAVYSEKNF